MRYICLFCVLFLSLIMSACSGTNTGNITSPSSNGDVSSLKTTGQIPLLSSERDQSGNSLEGMGTLGIFQGSFDFKSLTGELVPLRKSTLTDTLEVVDITNFLSLAPCVDCVKIKSISLDSENHPVVSIGIRHPFPAGDPFKPISGKNRADLHVFNVEGIVAFQSTGTHEFPTLGITTSDSGLYNPDGYTTYLDPYLDEIFPTDANAHPYMMHFDDYSQGNFNPTNQTGFESVTSPGPSGNLVMPMGCDYNYQDYVFDIQSDSSVEFIYAVGCTYAVSASSKAQRFTPEYRVPQHNKKAASEVRVEVISNDLTPGDTSSTAEIDISVLDINHGVPEGTNLNEMAHKSDVSAIFVEIPGVTSGYTTDFTSLGGDGRDPLNPLKFSVTITNTAGGGEGTYSGLVKVLDSYPVGQNQSPLLDGKDGIKRTDPLLNPLTATFDIAEFATYGYFTIPVENIKLDPIAVIQTTPDPPDVPTYHPSVIFDGSSSYDPDGGSITLFEWDFEWSGDIGDFSADLSTTDPISEYYFGCEGGTFKAGLRVTDDDTPAGISTIVSVDVTVTSGAGPTTWEGSTKFGLEERLGGQHIIQTGQMIQVASDGLVHLITYNNSGSPQYHITHRTFDGTTISPEEDYNITNYFSGATSAIDNNDDLHIVWTEMSPTDRKIRHTKTVNGSIIGSPADDLYTYASGYSSEWLDIQHNKSGDIMVTWINCNGDWTDSRFMYSVNDGSGFTTPDYASGQVNLRLNSTGSWHHCSPILVATPDDKFHQIFYMLDTDLGWNRVIYEIIYDGSSWSPMNVVWDDPSPYVPYDLDAVSTDDGDIHMVGPQLGGSNLQYFRFDAASGSWIAPINIATGLTQNFEYPAVEVDGAGNVHVVWQKTDGYLHLKVFCETTSESEIMSMPDYIVDNTTTNANQKHTDLAWDKDGNLMAMYQDEWFWGFYTYFNRLLY